MPKKILWVSQHAMNGVQMGALRRMFGVDVEVVEDDRPYDNAQTIVRRFRDGGYDDIIVVAPYSVLDRMCQLGLRPLWSDADQVFDSKLADWRVRDRMYRFIGFKRVVKMILELEDFGAAAKRQPED